MTWKLAPALAAGCTIVIKPSEHCPASTLGFAELIDAGRVPARRGQRRHRALPRDRRGAGVAPGRRQGRVHRLDGDRPLGGPRGRGEPQQGHAGAGRQVAAGRVPGRRPAGRGQRPRRGRVRGHRPDVHGGLAADRARVDVHDELVAARGRAGRADQARRPDRPGHRDGAGRQPAAVREGRRLPEDRAGGGRDRRVRRRGRGEPRRLLRQADRAHRREARPTPSSARRCSGRCSRRSRSPTRTRR